MRRIPDCHPDREHAAKGLCRPCYRLQPEVKESVRRCGVEWRKRPENKSKQLEYNRRRRAKRTKEQRFEQELKYKYGITIQRWRELVSRFDGACWICKRIPDTYLCVDHCHKTGEIRGVLCTTCNAGLGQFKESVVLLNSAVAYLTEPG